MTDRLRHATTYAEIEIKQNEDFSLGLLIVEIDEDGSEVIPDTADWEVCLQVRPEPMATSPVILEASTANGRIVTGILGTGDGQTNIDIKIPAGVPGGDGTAGLSYFGNAGYDLLCVFPGGGQRYYLAGPAILSPAYSWED